MHTLPSTSLEVAVERARARGLRLTFYPDDDGRGPMSLSLVDDEARTWVGAQPVAAAQALTLGTAHRALGHEEALAYIANDVGELRLLTLGGARPDLMQEAVALVRLLYDRALGGELDGYVHPLLREWRGADLPPCFIPLDELVQRRSRAS